MFSSGPSPAPTPDNAMKRKRRPAGTPDPDAEVVSLSPQTLLESDRYVCEICNQGFLRDQNLQMHRRRHKVPWKFLKRELNDDQEARKRVFVCPEKSCLHHDPSHALGDLVGIKKHFRRKHSGFKQWACAKCSKAYAVQSDYKAHLKTCGTRGHFCDCGRVFSRVESFIEHQDACAATNRSRNEMQPSASPSCTTSSPSPLVDINSTPPPPPMPNPWASIFLHQPQTPSPSTQNQPCKLQLLPKSTPNAHLHNYHLSSSDEVHDTKLQLSIGLEPNNNESTLFVQEKVVAEVRLQAKRQREMAERELENAKKLRQQAQAELCKALAMRERAIVRSDSVMIQITCQACRRRFLANSPEPTSPTSSSCLGL